METADPKIGIDPIKFTFLSSICIEPPYPLQHPLSSPKNFHYHFLNFHLLQDNVHVTYDYPRINHFFVPIATQSLKPLDQ